MNSEIPDVLFLSGNQQQDPSNSPSGGESQYSDPAKQNLQSTVDFQAQNNQSTTTTAETKISQIEKTLNNLAGDAVSSRGDVLFGDLSNPKTSYKPIQADELEMLDLESKKKTNNMRKSHFLNMKRSTEGRGPFEFLNISQNINKQELDAVLHSSPRNRSLKLRTQVTTDRTDQSNVNDVEKNPPSVQRRLQPAQTVRRFEWSRVSNQILGQNKAELSTWLTRILQKCQHDHAQSFGVLTCNTNGGGAPLAMALTRTFADIRKSIITNNPHCLLMDADIENPSIAYDLDLNSKLSWSEENHSSYDLDNCLIRSEEEKIDLLPLNCAVESPNQGRLPSKGRFLLPQGYATSLTERLNFVHDFARSFYPNLILNLGSYQFLSEMDLLSSVCRRIDHLLLVDQTPKDERTISRAYWRLMDLGIQNVVVIENELS